MPVAVLVAIGIPSWFIYASYVALTVLAVVSSDHQRRKAARKARDAYNASLQDRTIMSALASGPRSRIYGRARNVDGVIFKGTWGADKRYYTLIVALAGHEVDAIEDVYFNDQLVALDGSGYVTTAPWGVPTRDSRSVDITIDAGGGGSVTLDAAPAAGSVGVVFHGFPSGTEPYDLDITAYASVSGATVTVTGAPVLISGSWTAAVHYQVEQTRSYARVRKFTGAPTQDISGDLMPNFAEVTAADKFAGIALLMVDLEYSQDAFPTGLPQISAVVRGVRCFDPRTSTTAWTENPALHARDWSLYQNGGGCTSAQLDAAAITAAANACEVDSTFTTGVTPVTMDTYQSGIVCTLDSPPDAALGEMVEAMAGRWGWAGGRLRLVAGSYRAPVDTITEDWISDAEDLQVVPSPPRSELVNSYRISIANRDNGFVVEQMPALAPSSYIVADGQELTREIDMAAVTKREHALHVAGVLLRDGRQGLTVQLPCNMRAWRLELFDTVAVTLPRFGWSAKVFEVLGWRYSLQDGVALTLKETAASIYTVDAGFAGLGNSDNTNLPLPWQVESVSGLAISSDVSTQGDGQAVVRTLVQWTRATDINVLQSGWVEVQYLQLGLIQQPVSWVNGSAVPVAWENESAQPLGWNSLRIATGEGSNWQTVTARGDQTNIVVAALRARGVYIFRARFQNTVGARSAWCLQVLHVVGAAPLAATGETYSAFDAVGVGHASGL